MDNLKKYTNANKEAWNEVMPKHDVASKDWLDNSFKIPGFIYQNDEDLLKIFKKYQIIDKDIIHLCCNNGSELLSLKNMGAKRCLGVDISENAIQIAKNRALNSAIDCEFICSDVFDIPEEFFNSFDIVHITSGCIGWMPDLKLFFKICFSLLRKNGVLIIHEIHPFSEILPFDNSNIENRLQIVEPYFRDFPIEENSSLDYVGGTDYYAKTQFWFVHTISELILSLTSNNFNIEDFIESKRDISAGHKKIEILQANIPLSMIIVGRKNTSGY